MGEWVLVLLVGFGTSGGLTSETFNDKRACEFALEGAKATFPGKLVLGYCTPKHIEAKNH